MDGEPLGVDTRKATALLAYLPSTGGPQSRDAARRPAVARADPERARAALRRTLSTLRSALGGRWLDGDRAAVALERRAGRGRRRPLPAPGGAAGDGPAAIEPLSAAVALHRGDLLAGFGLRDSAALRRLAARRGRRAAGRARARARPAGRPRWREPGGRRAIAHAQRRLALDPLHEPAHRALIRLYAASGDRAEALRQYRECVRVLDRELGVRPLPETTRAVRRRQRGHGRSRRRRRSRPGRRAGPVARPAAGRAGPRVGGAGGRATRHAAPTGGWW